jgi:hypothetical protein
VCYVPDVQSAVAGRYNSTASALASGTVKQSTNEVLMVAPTAFTYNEQTAQDNHFMHGMDAMNLQVCARSGTSFGPGLRLSRPWSLGTPPSSQGAAVWVLLWPETAPPGCARESVLRCAAPRPAPLPGRCKACSLSV